MFNFGLIEGVTVVVAGVVAGVVSWRSAKKGAVSGLNGTAEAVRRIETKVDDQGARLDGFGEKLGALSEDVAYMRGLTAAKAPRRRTRA